MKTLIVWLTIAITVTPCYAIGGLFRRRVVSHASSCHVKHCAPKVKQQVVREKVVAVPQQVVNISNVYPSGSTVYGQGGVAQLGQLYGSNPSLAMQLASDNGKVWAQAFTAAVESGTASNEAIARVAQVQAATQHLQAATASSSSGTRVESLQITQGAGGVQVKRNVDSGQTQSQAQPRTGSILAAKCASCHGTDQASPKGGMYIDDGIDIPLKTVVRSLKILSGQNVPSAMEGLVGKLSDNEKGLLMEELLAAAKTQ